MMPTRPDPGPRIHNTAIINPFWKYLSYEQKRLLITVHNVIFSNLIRLRHLRCVLCVVPFYDKWQINRTKLTEKDREYFIRK